MPYQDIAMFGRALKLEDNELNCRLAGWLKGGRGHAGLNG
jgi:hypothetical protein